MYIVIVIYHKPIRKLILKLDLGLCQNCINIYLYDDGKILRPKWLFVSLVFLIAVVAGSVVHYFQSFSFSIDIRCIESL